MKIKNSSFKKLQFKLLLIVAFVFGAVESRLLYSEDSFVKISKKEAKCMIENCL